jgi:hypothetical protein
MNSRIDTVRQAVQKNCDIADARHAGDYSLCVYLLKMREYFRWVSRKAFDEALPRDEVGNWITEKEQYWEELENSDFEAIHIEGIACDPFDDADQINQSLLAQGYAYSGGLGQNCRPHFFLGRLLEHKTHEDYTIIITADELARDLTAPPAFTQQKNIFIRRESLRRMIWEKIEEWRWRKNSTPINKALSYYDVDDNLNEALEQITDTELETLLLHEIGEIKAGELLGPRWLEMLAALPRSQAELMARAIKDHIADCLSTLPSLLNQSKDKSLHFYFGNLRAMRKHLFPRLSDAYNQWIEHDKLEKVEQAAQLGCEHWRSVAEEILNLYEQHGDQSVAHIEKLVQDNIL